MKTFGLIGGVTWHSTIDYYRQINELVNSRLGGHHSAKIVLCSVDFQEILSAQEAKQPEKVINIIKNYLSKLESAGAELFAIGANTLHMYSKEIQAAASIPMVHIVDETAKEAKSMGLKKLGLLGTGFTMRSQFFPNRMKDFGIETIVPDDLIIEKIHRSIFNELVHGKINTQTKTMYIDVVATLQHSRCDGIILGCTELPQILDSQDAKIPLLDTTKIHTRAIVDMMLS